MLYHLLTILTSVFMITVVYNISKQSFTPELSVNNCLGSPILSVTDIVAPATGAPSENALPVIVTLPSIGTSLGKIDISTDKSAGNTNTKNTNIVAETMTSTCLIPATTLSSAITPAIKPAQIASTKVMRKNKFRKYSKVNLVPPS